MRLGDPWGPRPRLGGPAANLERDDAAHAAWFAAFCPVDGLRTAEPARSLEWMSDTGSLPIRESITKLPGYKDYVAKYPGIEVISANLANAKRVRPPTTRYPRVSAFVAEAIAQALLGRSDAKTALDQAAGKADGALAVPGS
ncbi:hypothetical protein [Nonomuraea sp. NPDC005650]|uniref:hypothetical protein n=1 Tax=Nonomuraea sp. NPDC005650 TaxID=3157045 RepID=UPI0033ACF247